MANCVLNGIMGLCVADALGVPVEFVDRNTLKKDPVINMRGYGTYRQPAGTWSDDTSMVLCLVDSLSKGLDYTDIMTNFIKWFNEGTYTPYGEVFDIGIATRKALGRFAKGTTPLSCGGLSDSDNGKGSLMRILPIIFYLQANYGTDVTENDEAMAVIHNVSALTHAHKRSLIACGIFASVACMLIGEMNLSMAVEMGIYRAVEYYKKKDEFADEIKCYERISRRDFIKTPVESIRSSGYVVDTLEAAIWCLLKTENYKDCVLMAVNLGEDTDTVAAVAGGLAGLYYGYESIPKEWLATIAKREYIESLCNQLYIALGKTSIEKLCAYIPYFETATKESVCHWGGGEKLEENHYTMTYPVYENSFQEFIQKVYRSNLMSINYLDITKSIAIENTEQMISAIDTADFELIKAILTGYVRQERFCDGLWASAVGDKVFLKILKRLQEF